MADYEKEQWQAEERAREDAQTAFRNKMAKSRQRSANNAKRKIARLHAKLKELGHISEFEDEFGESVLERLDKYGSAFHDPEKGRAGDALSLAQRQVVNRMNKKVKELKAKQKLQDNADSVNNFEEAYVRTGWGTSQGKTPKSDKSGFRQKNGFKRKSQFTPRVRQLDEYLIDENHREEACEAAPFINSHDKNTSGARIDTYSLPVFNETVRPFLPKYKPEAEYKTRGQSSKSELTTSNNTKQAKKPFLRVVSSD